MVAGGLVGSRLGLVGSELFKPLKVKVQGSGVRGLGLRAKGVGTLNPSQVYFLLVRIKIKHMELNIIRRTGCH